MQALKVDSGFGDDYYYHPVCAQRELLQGDLVPVEAVPESQRLCARCSVDVSDPARPNEPTS